jgi:hypothetical protein
MLLFSIDSKRSISAPIRKRISEATAKTIACSMMDGWLDYCNSAVLYFAGEHNQAAAIAKCRRTHVTKSSRFDHITRVHAERHWLPVQYRIQFKTAVTAFKVLTLQEASYFTELIRFHTPDSPAAEINYMSTLRSPHSLSELSATPHSLSGTACHGTQHQTLKR